MCCQELAPSRSLRHACSAHSSVLSWDVTTCAPHIRPSTGHSVFRVEDTAMVSIKCGGFSVGTKTRSATAQAFRSPIGQPSTALGGPNGSAVTLASSAPSHPRAATSACGSSAGGGGWASRDSDRRGGYDTSRTQDDVAQAVSHTAAREDGGTSRAAAVASTAAARSAGVNNTSTPRDVEFGEARSGGGGISRVLQETAAGLLSKLQVRLVASRR